MTQTVTIAVSMSELNLLRELRKIAYGEVAIFVKEGRPERIEKVKESIKLDKQ